MPTKPSPILHGMHLAVTLDCLECGNVSKPIISRIYKHCIRLECPVCGKLRTISKNLLRVLMVEGGIR